MDVDLLQATLRIERAWVQPAGRKPALGPPKTEAGARMLRGRSWRSCAPNDLRLEDDR